MLRSTTTGRRRLVVDRAMVGGALLVAVVWSFLFALDASDAEVNQQTLSQALGAVSRDTVRALDRGDVVGGGRRGRYLVRVSDTSTFGVQGPGLLLELDRHGFQAGTTRLYRSQVGPHRLLNPSRATAQVVLVVGPEIDRWRARDDAEEVASADLRTAEQRAEYERRHAAVVAELRAAGHPELVARLDTHPNYYYWVSTPGVSRRALREISALGDLPPRVAVFVLPPEAPFELPSV
jgi:hypothetical protein